MLNRLKKWRKLESAKNSERVNVQRSRMNKYLMAAFKRQVDGLLTSSEVKSVRECLEFKESDVEPW